MALPELDLNTPGSLWATASNEDNYTFHIVLPDPKYNKAALTKNPQVSSADQMMRPFTVSSSDVDGQGRALCDLTATGRVDDLIRKVNEIAKTQPVPERVTGIVIATAKPNNRLPAKQLADVQDCKLIAPAKVELTGVRTFVTVKNYKAGQKEFIVKLLTEGPLGKVKLSCNPKVKISVDGGPSGQGVVLLDAVHGKSFTLKIHVPLTMRIETKNTRVPPSYRNWVPGGWRTGGRTAKYDPRIGAWVVQGDGGGTREGWQTRKDKRELWTGGDITLTAEGTGRFNDKKDTIKLRAESFASGWLEGPPPPPFSHNVC